MAKLGLLLRKQEMTRLWVGEKLVPVTLLKLIPQQILRKKTEEKDWYSAIVVWSEKKELDKEKWIKEKYSHVCEYKVAPEDLDNFEIGSFLDLSMIQDLEEIDIYWVSKGKWFQWAIKRYGFSRWPETHGSHFHRSPGSVGWMKPRRVMKWKKLPGRMWSNNVKLKTVPIIESFNLEDENILAVKWSVPWAYNSLVQAK